MENLHYQAPVPITFPFSAQYCNYVFEYGLENLRQSIIRALGTIVKCLNNRFSWYPARQICHQIAAFVEFENDLFLSICTMESLSC